MHQRSYTTPATPCNWRLALFASVVLFWVLRLTH